VPLTRAEFEVLNLLITKAGQVINREALMAIVTHRRYGTNPRTVDVLIRRLRSKLEVDPSMPKVITTAHGEGYVFTGRLI
jgi:two-component system torCAD operon response regulator TorR